MLRHGLVTWGSTVEEAYGRHIDLVMTAERAIEEREAGRKIFTPRSFATRVDSGRSGLAPEESPRRRVAAQLLPVLRGLVSKREPKVIHFEDSDAVMPFVDSKEAADLSQVGPVTPDHMLYTKRVACYVSWGDPADVEGLSGAVKEAVEGFEKEYIEYVETRNRLGLPMLDPAPRVILVPGIGMFTVGGTPGRPGSSGTSTPPRSK